MQLVINSYGAYLRKSGNCFLVKREDKSFEVAVSKINSILITTSAYITTDAIKLAVDNNIDIVFLDAYGEPYGRVWHPKLGSTTLIRRRQLEIYDTSEGLNLAKEWGLKKLDNQIELLTRLKKTQRGEERGAGRIHRGDRAVQGADEEAAGQHRRPAAGHARPGGQGGAGLL